MEEKKDTGKSSVSIKTPPQKNIRIKVVYLTDVAGQTGYAEDWNWTSISHHALN